MKNILFLLLLPCFLAAQLPERKSALSVGTSVGFYLDGYYPQILGIIGSRYEWHPTPGIQLTGGFDWWILEGAYPTIPLDLTFGMAGNRGGGFGLSFGGTAQFNIGQPFFFPKIGGRIRVPVGQKGWFFDLLAAFNFHYSYDCGHGNCYGFSYRRDFGFAPAIGLAVGQYFFKKEVVKN